MLEGYHATFVETVPFKTITMFTLFQTTYLLICFGITWIPIAGVLFPLMIMLLVPVRQYVMPKLFKAAHLTELDAAEYEESPALAYEVTAVSSIASVLLSHIVLLCFIDQDSVYFNQEFDMGVRHSHAESGELLDELVTRSRGEIRRVSSPKVTSSTGTPASELQGLHSPRITERVYSPRVNVLRQEQSPRLGGRGQFSPGSGKTTPSKLGGGSRDSATK